MNVIYFVLFAVSPVFAAIAKDAVYSCSLTEFMCDDGACVSAELVCDGHIDCADASDELGELACQPGMSFPSSSALVLNRTKRQSACRKNQWKCRDGSCISFDGKCDGVVDCPDGSDETHPLCRKMQCQSIWFRCTYGACVDETAPCNGIQECADNSDELLPRCRNETEKVRGQFKCQDGSFITASNHCDGTNDCPDGSDETIEACAGKTCPSYLFQCAYGACVDAGADCNKIQECADGSDESEEMCGTTSTSTTVIKPPPGNCMLPSYPEHGTYISNIPGAQPGSRIGYKSVTLEVSCQRGYGVQGSSSVSCQNGIWQESMPICARQCRLDPNPSIEYRCLLSGDATGFRVCHAFEPAGTIVEPECRKPNYYSPTTLTFMRCIDGYWDYTARCTPGLIKHGTNITIIIKDTVEVYKSDLQYVVPINDQKVDVVSNSGFVIDQTVLDSVFPVKQGQSFGPLSNQGQSFDPLSTQGQVNDPMLNRTTGYYYGQFVPITEDNSVDDNNSIDEDVDINPRMVEEKNKDVGNINKKNLTSNAMKMHINITNSTVFINNSDRIVFRD